MVSVVKIQEIAISNYIPHPANVVAVALSPLRTDAGKMSAMTTTFHYTSLPRLLESPGQSWIFFLKIPGPGKSWKITLVLESPGNQSLRCWKVLEKYPSKSCIFLVV